MTRFIAVATALAATLSMTFVVGGCNLGAVPPNGGFLDSGTPGSGGDGGGSGDGGLGSCAPPSTNPPVGNHNQGMACINTACHLSTALGAGAPAFIIAGTVYTDSMGTTPAVGATVYIPDGANTYEVVTAGDAAGSGNFFVPMGSAAQINGGGTPEVSSCPSLWQTMTQTLSVPGASAGSNVDGNCNRGGCHNTGTDDIGRLHL